MKTHSVYAQVIFVFPAAFTPEGQRRSPAFVLLFAVFDESKSWYGEVGERRSRERFRKGNDRKEYHTINGYVNATLPGNQPEFVAWCCYVQLTQCTTLAACALCGNLAIISSCLSAFVCLFLGLKICQGRSSVIWHLIGMGTAPEIHSIQFQDHSLEVNPAFQKPSERQNLAVSTVQL